MASTYGWVQGSRGEATRTGGRNGITARAQTWETFVRVTVTPEGRVEPVIVAPTAIASLNAGADQ